MAKKLEVERTKVKLEDLRRKRETRAADDRLRQVDALQEELWMGMIESGTQASVYDSKRVLRILANEGTMARMAELHESLERKYRQAARRPWEMVPADPEEPTGLP